MKNILPILATLLVSSLANAGTPIPTISIGDAFIPVADMTVSSDLYFRDGKRGNGYVDQGSYCNISPEQYAEPVKIKAGEKLTISVVRGAYFIPRGDDGLEADAYMEMGRGDGRWEIRVYCARPKTGNGSDQDWTLEEIEHHLGKLFTYQLNPVPLTPVPGKTPAELLGSKIRFNADFSSTGYRKIRFQGGAVVEQTDSSRPSCYIDSSDGFSGFAVRSGEELVVARVFGGYFSAVDSRPVATLYDSNFRFTAQGSSPKFQLVCSPATSARKVGLSEIQEAMGRLLTVL